MRSNGTAVAFTPLSPRQAVSPAPYAFWAANASQAVTVSGTVPGSGLNGLYPNPVSFNNPANGFAGDGGGLKNVDAAQLGGRTVGQFWQTGGNTGANPTNNAFLGTSDNQPLEFRVNGQRALRLEPGTNSFFSLAAVNVIGGSSANTVSDQTVGAFIGGGGSPAFPNRVDGAFGAVVGGESNRASGIYSTAAGLKNHARGPGSVAMGWETTAGDFASVAMGLETKASGYNATAIGERTTASGYASTALGSGTAATNNNSTALGRLTLAGGSTSTALGYRSRALHNGSFVWADQQEEDFDSTSPNQFAVRASGGMFIDGWLGIGHSRTPSWPLEVKASQAVGQFTTTNSPFGSVVVLRNSGESPTYLGAVNFDGVDETPGQIAYLATNAMVFRVGSVERMTLDSAGLKVDGQPVLLSPSAGQPLVISPNSASAWRFVPSTTSPNIIGGYAGNLVSNGFIGAFIGGGGNSGLPNLAGGNYASVLGGLNNGAIGEFSTAMGIGATSSGSRSTAMGWDTTARGEASTAMGAGTVASGRASTAMGESTVAGGRASTAMGLATVASGVASTAMGSQTAATNNDATALGRLSLAGGSASAAMGYRARALHNGSFVWADQRDADFNSTANNQFSIRAGGGVRLNNDTSLNFGNQTRQMLNLWDTGYGIGVQTDAQYFRSFNEFIWYRGGSHSDAFADPGSGGTQLMRLGGTGNLIIAGTLSPTSDRNVKEGFAAVDAREVLAKVAALPIQSWSYTNDVSRRHIGPVAQDFHSAFGLNGTDDKHIATVDADGVALAAIQGLNQRLTEELKRRDTENASLRERVERLEGLLRKLSDK